MILLVPIILWIVAATIALPMLVVAGECLVGLLRGRRTESDNEPHGTRVEGRHGRASVAVLVPAHNEESGIAHTLAGVKAQLTPRDRLIVIADNCTDATARVAREAGAEVFERTDANHRGKGYALAAGVAFLRNNPRAVVICFDADCTLGPRVIDALAHLAVKSNRPTQAINLIHPPDSRDAGAMISAFAFLVKNQARFMGLHRLGVAIPLTGTGMAFPYGLLRDAPLASGDIVEDLSLGLHFIRMGQGAMLCPAACIDSLLPESRQAAAAQRSRWEHGYLSALLTCAPMLIRSAIHTRRFRLLLSAMDLAVPPLSLLMMLFLIVLVLEIIAGTFLPVWGPMILLIVAGALLTIALALAWRRYARAMLPPAVLLRIPLYVAWKIPIYLRFIYRREKAWVRAERSTDSSVPSTTDVHH